MALIQRLIGSQEPKIPVHQFWAGLFELHLGKITETQFKEAFEIASTEDLNDWTWLRNRYIASTNKTDFILQLHSIFMLAERRMFNYHDATTMVNRIVAIP